MEVGGARGAEEVGAYMMDSTGKECVKVIDIDDAAERGLKKGVVSVCLSAYDCPGGNHNFHNFLPQRRHSVRSLDQTRIFLFYRVNLFGWFP